MALTVDSFLAPAALASPHRVAATLGDASTTFGELQEQTFRLANALLGLGVGHGDRVAHWADLSLDVPPTTFAISRIGAVYAPLNPAYTDDEARALLAYLDPRLLVVDDAHREAGTTLARELGIPVVAQAELAVGASAAAPSVRPPAEHDLATIFATSGSTGRPKGVMVSHRATWMRSFAGAGTDAACGGRGEVVMFPLFHMAGWCFAFTAWSAHKPVHFVTRADGDAVMDAVVRHHAGALYCIPAVWRRVLDSGLPGGDDLEWAKVGTSFSSPDLVAEIRERFPRARMTVSYGSTETGGALRLGDDDVEARPGAVGLPVPGMLAKTDAEGELMLAGDTLMSGYYAMPEETAAVLEDGWFRTGDLVEQDADGFYTVVGRRKEMIRTGGEWVAPSEVEDALRGIPGIADLAIVGIPDESWGEIVCAVVVPAPGADAPSADDLRRHLSGRLAPFKHPRRVVAVDLIPRTSATGQVQRSVLVRQEGAR